MTSEQITYLATQIVAPMRVRLDYDGAVWRFYLAGKVIRTIRKPGRVIFAAHSIAGGY